MKLNKILFLGLMLFFAMPTAWAQTDKRAQRKIERAEKKRLQEEERRNNQALVMDLLQNQSFVLQATTLSGRYQEQNQVNPSTNFVQVRGGRLVVQTARNFGMGYNGLGGITIDGTIQDYEVRERKNGANVFIRFSDPVLGHSTLSLHVHANGNASATVVGNWGARANFQGQFVALDQSVVFKGQSLF